MTESGLKRDLMKALHLHVPSFVCIRHEDRFTSGIPDLSVTGNGRTTWWEAKLIKDNQDVIDRKVQAGLIKRLSIQGFAAYIVWQNWYGERTTHIISPTTMALVKRGQNLEKLDGYHFEGHDMELLVAYILGAHGK